jgi:predicted RNase H-like HicB family nuclease
LDDPPAAVIAKCPPLDNAATKGQGYIAFVEELPGANARGVTLEEARTNLQEAVQLVLEANRALVEETLRDKSVIREPFAQIS